MANRRFNQFFNTLHAKPVLLDCEFIVSSTAGAGVTGLVGPGIQAVYMHSSSPSSSNPNPQNGYAIIQLQDNYNAVFDISATLTSPNSGTPISINGVGALTIGNVYVITSVGSTTAAQWQAAGVPVGITPAVGVAFVAKITQGSGSGVVQVPKATGSGITVVDVIGNPATSVTSLGANRVGISNGAYVVVRFLAATAAGNTALVATAPADGTSVGISLYLSSSRIKVQGE